MKKVHVLDHCRVMEIFKGKMPLADYEYERILEMAIDCPLEGMPFDQISYLYSLQVPLLPKLRTFSEDPEVVSASLRLNFSKFVSVIGGKDLKKAIIDHPGAVLFVVGSIIEKIKGDNAYYNLRPRGWLIVVDREYRKRMPAKKNGRKK
jgi:hypothetical protein